MCVVCRLMASKKQHLESLRSVALFSACSNKELDKVAYVRFASVYKNFQAADDFDKFVSELRPDQALEE